jgi:hypothetical protein
MRSTASGIRSDRTMRPTPNPQVRSEPVLTGINLRVVAAPRVGLEPTTLRFEIESTGWFRMLPTTTR